MKKMQELYDEKLNRIRTAVALEKPDRVPVVPLATAFYARHRGALLHDFALNPEVSTDTMLKSLTSLGEIDGIPPPLLSICNEYSFSFEY
jgi:hypothetical protein